MTIRIFVGCSANGEDAEAQAMLEYTLRKYATQPLEIVWMMLSRDPQSPWYSNPQKSEGWNQRGWATPFSPFRWAIPHVCNFQGMAIYMDVDMIARADIADLWKQKIPNDKAMLAKDGTHSCVILFDCEKIKSLMLDRSFWMPFDTLRRVEGGYRTLRKNISAFTSAFLGNWNCLDGENYSSLSDPDIKVIHFTKVETQPHLKWALPRLVAEGNKHWNAATLKQTTALPHARSDVAPLVDSIWEEARASGYTVEKYNLGLIPYGQYDAVRGGARAA